MYKIGSIVLILQTVQVTHLITDGASIQIQVGVTLKPHLVLLQDSSLHLLVSFMSATKVQIKNLLCFKKTIPSNNFLPISLLKLLIYNTVP